MSARGELCLIERDRLSGRTVNLLNQGLDYEAIDRDIMAASFAESTEDTVHEINHAKVNEYTIEENAGSSSAILDISQLMMHRLQAGYQVDRFVHNEALSARFMTCKS